MDKLILAAFCAMLLWSAPEVSNASAATSPLSLGVQTGYLYGNAGYSISEYYGTSGFQSKLEFPLETAMGGVNIVYRSDGGRSRKKVIFTLSWMTNLGSGSGKVRDSDWLSDDNDISLVGSAHPGLDIYSESDMRLDANLFEFRADVRLARVKKASLGPMIGFKHQRFEYDILNVQQVGYGPYAASFTGSTPGLVGRYEANYSMLYFGASADVVPEPGGTVAAMARIGVSPFVFAEDEDDHMLRYKVSNGSATGAAFFVSLGTELKIGGSAAFRISGEYLRLFTEGTQDQYFYAGPDAGQRFSVSDEIESRQLWLSASLMLRLP